MRNPFRLRSGYRRARHREMAALDRRMAILDRSSITQALVVGTIAVMMGDLGATKQLGRLVAIAHELVVIDVYRHLRPLVQSPQVQVSRPAIRRSSRSRAPVVQHLRGEKSGRGLDAGNQFRDGESGRLISAPSSPLPSYRRQIPVCVDRGTWCDSTSDSPRRGCACRAVGSSQRHPAESNRRASARS